MTALTNPKFELRIENEKSFEEAWISYEELIYDKLKKKLQNFISDLVVNEKDFTELRKEDDNNDIEIFVTYLKVRINTFILIFIIYLHIYTQYSALITH